ncbi:unnamed protein product [Ambrosiozyma monospora]|uniref:Unnamed protein product n=1 Tax=Ambrosiozyma monospora TaxID=43982 RepID=A0A9W6YQS6_AMBMO|nr:unnamed protein product [Ambrosiozyma monospora]
MSRAFSVIALVSVATLGYCVYFDYQRRHNPEFRKSILRTKRRATKKAKLEAEQDKTKKLEELKEKLNESLIVEPLPTELAEKENFFLNQVTVGEQLAAIPGNEVDAAIHFYKGLAVYPNPQGILDIYQRTISPEVYNLVMMLAAIQVPRNVANILGDSVASLSVGSVE